MKKIITFTLLSFLYVPLYTQEQENANIEIFSEYVGETIGKGLKPLEGCYDLEAIIRGLKNVHDGKTTGLHLTEDEELEKILEMQNKLFEKRAAENLLKAERFLEEIAQQPGVKIICKQLVYEQLKEGKGANSIAENSSPLLRYAASTLDGTELMNTFNENEPCVIPIIETITGFAKGTIGMKEGERRRIYIHPDLAYKKMSTLPPNSLLILEVEVLQIQAT
jgi:FKBP-type peptidyl-prolyl cis-trans isomerase